MWNQVEVALDQSMVRVFNEFARILPGFVALIVAMVFATLVAWLISFLARRFLQAVRLDERLEDWGLPILDRPPAVRPAILVSRVIFWAVVITGFLIGIAAFDATLTSQLVLQIFNYLPNLFVAAVILIAGNVVARFLSRSVLIGGVNMNFQYASLLATGVKWLILVLAVAMALDHLGIAGNIVHLAFGILFGGIVLALVLAVGLGSKDLVSRSLEREARKQEESTGPFRHL